MTKANAFENWKKQYDSLSQCTALGRAYIDLFDYLDKLIEKYLPENDEAKSHASNARYLHTCISGDLPSEMSTSLRSKGKNSLQILEEIFNA